MTTFQWHPGQWPADSHEIRQATGFVVGTAGQVLVLEERGTRFLPGGRPEPSDASVEETLRRECLEEAGASLTDVRYAGYVLVNDGEDSPSYAQLRFTARLSELAAPAPDPDTGRTYQRSFVPLPELPGYLGWGPHLVAQVATVLEMLASEA